MVTSSSYALSSSCLLLATALMLPYGSTVEGSPLVALPSFLYEDDFETQKIEFDSYSHSPVVHADEVILPEGDYLRHEYFPPTAVQPNVLQFYDGEDPGPPYLGYAALPTGAVALGGSIEFDRPDPQDAGILSVRVSHDAENWLILGESRGGGPVGRHVFDLPPGAPAQFIEFRGSGTIDNLAIAISYVPEPSAVVWSLGIALFVLRRSRRTSAGRG